MGLRHQRDKNLGEIDPRDEKRERDHHQEQEYLVISESAYVRE